MLHGQRFYKRNLSLYLTFKNATQDLNSKDIERAEIFWIREAQKTMDKHVKDEKYKRLCPRIRSDGIYVISGRGEKWMEMSYGKGRRDRSVSSMFAKGTPSTARFFDRLFSLWKVALLIVAISLDKLGL